METDLGRLDAGRIGARHGSGFGAAIIGSFSGVVVGGHIEDWGRLGAFWKWLYGAG
jgi:hypothetical protein